MTALPQLPHLLALAFDTGGIETVRRLVKTLGGRHMYLPSAQNLPQNHILAQVVGAEAAQIICREMGPAHVEIPKGHGVLNLFLAAKLYSQGASYNTVQTALGITWNGARQLKKRVFAAGGPDQVLARFGEKPKKAAARIDGQSHLEDVCGAPETWPPSSRV